MKRKQKLPLPLQAVKDFEKQFPNCWHWIEFMREGKGKDIDDWNDICYAPITATNEILRAKYNIFDGNLASLYAALASWRQYKEIYSFSDELREVLYEQAEEDIVIPIEILYQIPYPCIYITLSKDEGFFVFFEHDINTNSMELRFCFISNNEEYALNTWLHLVKGYTISEGVEEGMRMIRQNLKLPEVQAMNLPYLNNVDIEELQEEIYKTVSKSLQLVLYICAENAEIEENQQQKQITHQPSKNSKPKDVYREIRAWDVGIKFANNVQKLRNQSLGSENNGNSKNSPRPHTRRGHWHHYWVGSHSDNSRKLILKWTAPMFVGGNSDETITTINEVK